MQDGHEVITYTVTAERGARAWVLQCVELPSALSEVHHLDQADAIREAIAFVAGVDLESVEYTLVVKGVSVDGDPGAEPHTAEALRTALAGFPPLDDDFEADIAAAQAMVADDLNFTWPDEGPRPAATHRDVPPGLS